MNSWGLIDVSVSPLAELLPDRCTPDVRRLQAELSARHSYREAARLLAMLLPRELPNHATMRDRTHKVAAKVEVRTVVPARPEAKSRTDADMLVLIDGAHIRAAPGHQAGHVDVAAGKIEVAGRAPRRFALAAKGAVSPAGAIRQPLKDQGQPGRSVTMLSDGEAALSGLIQAALVEPVVCIPDVAYLDARPAY